MWPLSITYFWFTNGIAAMRENTATERILNIIKME